MKKNIILLFMCFFSFFTIAEQTPVKNLYKYVLPNELTLFVYENHNVPLCYIETAVKAGSSSQSEENAGLFHLYEHMLFKGNELYPDAQSVNRSLSDMGVTSWNGTTDIEHINYYFTIPSSKLEKGLEFWNAALVSPLFDKQQLENEKLVVISEIQACYSGESRILWNFKAKTLFPSCPWKLDTSGTVENVKNATVSKLRKIQKKYYIPNNTALFVGGDVNPEEVYNLTLKIFSSWKKGKNPFKKENLSKNPLSQPVFAVYPREEISPEIASCEVLFRAADTENDVNDTYSLDVLCSAFNNPQGIFKKNVVDNGFFGVSDSSFTGFSYITRKSFGIAEFYAYMTYPESELCERVSEFKDKVVSYAHEEISCMTDSSIKEIALQIEDENIFAFENAESFLKSLRFWWICSDENYFFTYNRKMQEVTTENLDNIVKNYFEIENPLVVVSVHPSIYEAHKGEYEKNGFFTVSAKNSFWFMDENYEK